MPRPALQPAEVDAFRKKAVEAAMHLFAEEGYAAVTMRGLGAALGVSAMTPYRYLSGKDELFALCRAEAFRRFGDRLEAALAKPGNPIDRLRRLKQAYIGFALEQPDAYRIMFEVREPTASEPQAKRAFGCLHRTVAEAVEAGELDGDPLTLAHLFWASTHGLVSLHLAGRLVSGRRLEQLAAIDHEITSFKKRKR